ncbi:urea amidolyase associated protein UAAP1 [Syntrophobotulus glycolicus]|nr:urea amidolyase associated protein UAAP1 [Syntrophobotulus glycolicus]
MNTGWKTTLRSGEKWSGIVGRNKLLKFTAMEAGANIAMLLFNSRDLTEKYSMPDTLKAQHTAHLTRGNVLMSDNGRILASLVEDRLEWHDTISGITTRVQTDEKYGRTDYQQKKNMWLRSGYENFMVELVRNGLQPRDMAAPVNLFSKVQCDDEGNMRYIEGHCQQGDTVALRTEMDVLIILSNTPNPLDGRTAYPSVPVAIEVLPAIPADFQDYCVNNCPENRRAYENTREYYLLLE